MDISTLTFAINNVSSFLDALIDFVPKLVSIATVMMAFLPPPKQDSFLLKPYQLINAIAFNFKHAANARKDAD